jgi:hypothetical protein
MTDPARGPLPENLSTAGLASLLREEQRKRWQKGERPPVEEYLARHPGLAENPSALLDLVYAEVVLREQHGESPTLEEYLVRFPRHDAELRRQFDLHKALGSKALLETGPVTESPSTSAARPEERLPKVPGYEVLGVLARGGMGVIFRARQENPPRTVALKMIRADQLPEPGMVARFRLEAEAEAQLEHENIVPIYEVGEHDGVPFFSMRLIEGGSLADQVPRFVERPREAAALVEVLARAVQHAHERRVGSRALCADRSHRIRPRARLQPGRTFAGLGGFGQDSAALAGGHREVAAHPPPPRGRSAGRGLQPRRQGSGLLRQGPNGEALGRARWWSDPDLASLRDRGPLRRVQQGRPAPGCRQRRRQRHGLGGAGREAALPLARSH